MTTKENDDRCKVRGAHPDHHATAFDFCVAGRFSDRQALVMARGFAARGFTDASEGCTHYALRMIVARANARDS